MGRRRTRTTSLLRVIDIRQLVVHQGDFQLGDVSFHVAPRTYAVLMGRTGCGKTTLLECICGLRSISAGTIQIGGQNVTHRRPGDRGIGYVPQDGALFPTMTVAEHLAFPLRMHAWPRSTIRHRVAEVAASLQLTALLKRRPQGLSGGERQRVALGRAVAFRPQVLLLDEPLSALDEPTRLELVQVLKAVHSEIEASILHVTHHPTEADLLGEQRLRLVDGCVVESP